jgi:hypothetical protein
VAPGPTEPPDFSDLRLPAGLLTELKEAVRLNNVTHLDRHLQRLEEAGTAPARLAAHLGRLRQRLELRAIAAVLEQVQHE